MFSSFKIYFILGAAALTFLSGTYAGYKIGNARYTSLINKIQAEHLRQIEEMNKRQKEATTILEDKNKQLEKVIEENEIQAESDPNASSGGISSSSVLRLNRIK